MPQKFDPKNNELLVSNERREQLDTHRVLSLLPILHYHVVADIGCGPGYFTVPFAKHVFEGKVYAIDVQQEMLDATKEAVDRVRLTNVELIRSTEKKLGLGGNRVDGALMAFVLQEAENRQTMLKQAHAALNDSGWLGILEWHKREEDQGPPVEQRIEEPEMRKMAEKVGFRFSNRYNLNSSQYMLLMRK